MGKGGGSGGGGTTTTISQPPQQVLDAYTNVMNKANTVADAPLQQYQQNIVAGFTPDQQSAFNTIDQSQGIANPYINQAAGLINQSTQPLWSGVQQYSPDAISQYQNPYTQQVVDATTAQLQNMDQQQQQSLKGNAISSGAWGGDRAGVASAALSGQQDLANNQTIAGLYNQGFQQAQGEFNNQQQAQLGANEANAYLGQQGAFGLANLGNEAQNSALAGASAQLTSGGLQQQQNQANLNVPYQQFLQQQAYPFQTTQYLANIAEGIGGSSGGTSSSTAPGANQVSQGIGTAAGLGSLGYLGYLAFSDRRVKENIEKVGGFKNYPTYEFNYKGDDPDNRYTGVMAQDVEKTNPDAVKNIDGIKAVDYSKLARGGPTGFAPGGNIPDVSLSYVPTPTQGVIGGNTIPRPPSTESGSSQDSSGMSLGNLLGLLKASGLGKGSSGGSSLGGMSPDISSIWGSGASNGMSFGDTAGAASSASNASDFLGPTEDAGFGSFGGFSGWNRGGAAKYADGGTTHKNAELAGYGSILGNLIGSIWGPIGGLAGKAAGHDGGQMMGDAIGGDWGTVGSDFGNTLVPKNPLSGEAWGGFQPFKRGGGLRGHYEDGGDILTPDDVGLNSPSAIPSYTPPPENTKSDAGYDSGKIDPVLALLATAGGIGANGSPQMGVNFGAGALAGVKNLGEQRKQAATENYQTGELGVRKQEAQARAQQMAAEAERWRATIAQNQEKIDQGHYTSTPYGLMDTKSGKLVPYTTATEGASPSGGGSSTPAGENPVGTSGFKLPGYINNSTVMKNLSTADAANVKAGDLTRQIGTNILNILDHMEPSYEPYNSYVKGNSGLSGLERQAAGFTGLGGDAQSQAYADLKKNSNDLATEWQKFQYVPGGRGSVLALKTILASKPGTDQPIQTNQNITNELREKVYNNFLDEELAQKYRALPNSSHIADSNVDNLDRALKKLYPLSSTDPKTGAVTFNKDNVDNIRNAMDHALANPDQYFKAAGMTPSTGMPSRGGTSTVSSAPVTGGKGPNPPTPQAAGSAPPVTQEAIQFLNQHPDTAAHFEEKFGVSAQDYLQ